MTAHWIIFPVAPDPFPVLIAFVAGDVEQNFDAGGFADGLKYGDRAADIRVESQFGFGVREADKRLGGKVKDNFRLIFLKCFHYPVEVPDISMNMS